MTGERSLDIQDALRGRVIDKLKRSGASEEQLRCLRSRCEVTTAERNQLFGEELPAGLSLAAD